MTSDMLHHSVLLQEVVNALGPEDGHYYLDATFGNGGYSRAYGALPLCKKPLDHDSSGFRVTSRPLAIKSTIYPHGFGLVDEGV